MSKISICNEALARLGAESIRSFDENNKSARMCSVFYDATVLYLLGKADWPFAARYKQLQNVVMVDGTLPPLEYAYALPSDCAMARDIWPKGSRTWWCVRGKNLICKIPPGTADVGLYYTLVISDTSMFSDTFSHLLALGLAVKLAPPITQDKALTSTLYQQFINETRDVEEADANVGNEYRHYDETPEHDTFVSPEGYLVPEDIRSNR